MSKIFAKGISFKRPHDKAPEYIKGSLSIKADEFVKFLQTNSTNGWVNLDLKESIDDKLYFELNTWNRRKEMGKNQQGIMM